MIEDPWKFERKVFSQSSEMLIWNCGNFQNFKSTFLKIGWKLFCETFRDLQSTCKLTFYEEKSLANALGIIFYLSFRGSDHLDFMIKILHCESRWSWISGNLINFKIKYFKFGWKLFSVTFRNVQSTYKKAFYEEKSFANALEIIFY